MKKITLLIMLVAIGFGLFEQTKTKPNIYILIVCIVVFMYGMMQLSAKTLHHNQETNTDEDDHERR